MGICIISRFAFAGLFTGGGVPVTLSALHYPPMKRCSAVALFESSPCQHKKQTWGPGLGHCGAGPVYS